jgi:hypothetical protein
MENKMANKLKELLANMSQEELLAQWEELDSREIQSPLVSEYFDFLNSNPIVSTVNEGIDFTNICCGELTYKKSTTPRYSEAA